MIKVDVEGAELFVLEGARSILEQPPNHAPVIVFEYDVLSSSGYAIYLIGSIGEATATKAVDVYPMRHVNLVAAKDEKKLPLAR